MRPGLTTFNVVRAQCVSLQLPRCGRLDIYMGQVVNGVQGVGSLACRCELDALGRRKENVLRLHLHVLLVD